ncbi:MULTISPECIES: cytochrome c oxidase subunit 3 [Pseudoxanthomonas]|jgi:cytochrome c oxidase subunit 3|uniref:Probable cytochrome c oxidase subunit 3 n=1 Tax=Pseudoxanthomonas winnipegensis TaxID=2480810 RepID=A0A4Q8L6T9_9GAMM|nr:MULTISPECIES: cytochrome c oxidase subunit 3 [Pseudoxanthomonas]PZP60095.1 MAG: cytochrome c oxidase subunit 3 [Pseudoxanthomonas spadix]HCH0557095.1 cytochrome c oxidase subunit 3 [Pseudomonas aeruginosa]TAA23344.1 cytochrome c oxidase subunit 3 [Pseudoxanthomonas winnipegensis]TMN15235.1 cytochrome c oxidase subunit 3 [Pseudoxanthomonas sp. X-1]UAY74386.1 cytochrome c oxidase subunit 3 [Pseudoxanthomonas sp. X-1]
MAQTHSQDADVYFVPAQSKWPFVGSIAMFVLMIGVASWLNDAAWGKWTFLVGVVLLAATLFMWFGDVIRESVGGRYNGQVDVSFRMGMVWFIFSEVMFFAAFFGALFYTRTFALPWLGGQGDGVMTNALLWEGYSAGWPTNGPAMVGGTFQTIPAWGLPLINTLILLTSGVTLTIAHHALKAAQRGTVLLWLGITVLLGITFLYFQVTEYAHAYHALNLTLGSGIYGSTFFMLTGFHGAHVFLGTLMLAIMWLRVLKGHFSKDHHFAFEAAAWYWHFVDVVWLALFLFVYVL